MSEDKKPKYILCPRCELNYIEESEQYCKVCKAEMGLLDPSILIPDEEEVGVEKLCPVCKVNYIGEDEEICFMCQKERDSKEEAAPEEEDEDAWRNFVDEPAEEPDDMEISLSELEEEEAEDEPEDKHTEEIDFDELSDEDFALDDEEADDEEEEPDDEDNEQK